MMTSSTLDGAVQSLIDAVDREKQIQYWLIVVEGGIEPELRGPYLDGAARLQAARALMEDYSEEDYPGVFKLDIQGVILSVIVEPFAGYEMYADDEYGSIR